MEAYLSPDTVEDCFTIMPNWWANEFLGVTYKGLRVGGDTCRSRDDSKALLERSPRHGEKLRKAALWSSLWDLQATLRLGEASLCNSVEVVYYFHDVKLVRSSSSSSSPSHVMFVYFLSLLSHTSPWWRGRAMLQFRGNCCVRGEPSVLRSGFLGF